MRELVRQIGQRLRTDRRAALAVAIAIAANVLVAGLYVWSRGGQTTVIDVLVLGESAGVSVDGQLQAATGRLPNAPAAGGLVITLADTENIPSVPEPRGISRVEVIDFVSGDVLFEDDFGDGIAPDWEASGGLLLKDGVVGSTGDARLVLTGSEFRDVRVRVEARNVQSVEIGVRVRERDLYGVMVRVRPFHWNEDATRWLTLTAGRPGVTVPGTDLELSRTQSIKSMAAMLTRPYPYVLLLGLIFALVVALLSYIPRESVSRVTGGLPHAPAAATAAALGAATTALVLGFYLTSLANTPYVPDSIAYVFQGKIFASGHLTADPPPVRGAFDFFVPAPFALTGDSWAAQYPFFHPLSLAAGEIAGATWLIPPLFAGGSVVLMFLFGRRVYGTRVGLLAAAMLALSPFFIMNASNYMSHNTAGFLLLGALFCLRARPHRTLLFGAAAGAAFGLLLNTRPMTALALTAPFGVYLLAQLLPVDTRGIAARHVAAFLAAATVMALLFLGWNYTITGDAFRTGYQSTGVTFFPPLPGDPGAGGGGGSDLGDALGAGGSHSGAIGIQNERIQLGLLLLVLHGWPAFIGLAFSMLPFLLGTRRWHDWFFLACAVAATVAWVGYESTGVMYGPRYWYEAMPFLILLAARGTDRAADLIASGVGAAREGDVDTPERPVWAGRLVMYGFVALLIAFSAYSWLLGQRTEWRADLVPNRAEAMCCVLGLDDRIHVMVEEQDLHNALVLVDPCGNNFVCYGSVFWRNAPFLDGDIVYARDIRDRRQEIIAAYPGREVYVATYLEEPTLRPLFRVPTN